MKDLTLKIWNSKQTTFHRFVFKLKRYEPDFRCARYECKWSDGHPSLVLILREDWSYSDDSLEWRMSMAGEELEGTVNGGLGDFRGTIAQMEHELFVCNTDTWDELLFPKPMYALLIKDHPHSAEKLVNVRIEREKLADLVRAHLAHYRGAELIKVLEIHQRELPLDEFRMGNAPELQY